jgi:hypothetical protein
MIASAAARGDFSTDFQSSSSCGSSHTCWTNYYDISSRRLGRPPARRWKTCRCFTIFLERGLAKKGRERIDRWGGVFLKSVRRSLPLFRAAAISIFTAAGTNSLSAWIFNAKEKDPNKERFRTRPSRRPEDRGK